MKRNEPCHCGSGKKYKKCCATKDYENAQEQKRIESESTDTPTGSRGASFMALIAMLGATSSTDNVFRY